MGDLMDRLLGRAGHKTVEHQVSAGHEEGHRAAGRDGDPIVVDTTRYYPAPIPVGDDQGRIHYI